MRVLLSTYGTGGDIGPLVELAVQLPAIGAEVRMCAPPPLVLPGRPFPPSPFPREPCGTGGPGPEQKNRQALAT